MQEQTKALKCQSCGQAADRLHRVGQKDRLCDWCYRAIVGEAPPEDELPETSRREPQVSRPNQRSNAKPTDEPNFHLWGYVVAVPLFGIGILMFLANIFDFSLSNRWYRHRNRFSDSYAPGATANAAEAILKATESIEGMIYSLGLVLGALGMMILAMLIFILIELRKARKQRTIENRQKKP